MCVSATHKLLLLLLLAIGIENILLLLRVLYTQLLPGETLPVWPFR